MAESDEQQTVGFFDPESKTIVIAQPEGDDDA